MSWQVLFVILYPVCNHGFPNAKGHQGSVCDIGNFKPAAEQWYYIRFHHAFHFMRNAGHADKYLPVLFKDHPGSCSAFVLDHGAHIRNFSLFDISFSQRSFEYLFKKHGYILQCLLIHRKLSAEIFTQQRFGDVVGRWPQSASDENNISMFRFFIQRIPYFIPYITHSHTAVYPDA